MRSFLARCRPSSLRTISSDWLHPPGFILSLGSTKPNGIWQIHAEPELVTGAATKLNRSWMRKPQRSLRPSLCEPLSSIVTLHDRVLEPLRPFAAFRGSADQTPK